MKVKFVCAWISVLLLSSQSAFALEEKPKILTLEYAQKIASKSDAYAKAKGWKVAIAIVNSEGNLLYFQRNPEAYSGSIESSIQKAKSANAFQRPTSSFVEGVKQGRTGLVSVAGVVVIEGGVPIVLGGKHVGSIGISGAKATEDEEAAKAGLE